MAEFKLREIPDYKHILVGVDSADDAQLAFAYAVKRAALDHARLSIVSIIETDNFNVYEALSKDHIVKTRAEVEAQLATYADAARAAGVVDVHTCVAEGDPGKTMVEDVIPHIKPDLLVIGAATKTGIARHFGSQAAVMAKYAPIATLIVR